MLLLLIQENNKFLIYVYCLQKDINNKNEENKLKTLYFKHGICYQHGYRQQF